MEAKFTFDGHADADTLEEYAFGRLSVAGNEAVEEHILTCPDCQGALAEVDEYILLMKAATAQLVSSRRRLNLVWFRSRSGKTGIGATVLVMIFLGALTLWPSHGSHGASSPGASSIQLVALRGDDTLATAHARGGPLDLLIDVADLPGVGRFRLELVNAVGRRHWDGEAAPTDGKLAVRVPKTLGLGTYWVRLSTGDGELLREFGLRVD